MARQGRWRKRLGHWALAAGLAGVAGCMGHLHPLDPPPPELTEVCQEIPKCSRDHVYIFLVQGVDMVDCANLAGVRDYLNALGFRQTYFGQLFHVFEFEDEIRRIASEDPDARFVLIGFSFGANMVRDIANAVACNGINIDLLVYLGGNTLKNIPRDRPENACRIINILAQGCIFNGAELDGALNLIESDVWHFGSPTHPTTLKLLSEELLTIAGSIPFVVMPEEETLPPDIEEAPTPRPVTIQTSDKRDEWDFLKPVSRLRRYERPEQASEPPPATPKPVDTPDKIAAR